MKDLFSFPFLSPLDCILVLVTCTSMLLKPCKIKIKKEKEKGGLFSSICYMTQFGNSQL